MEDFWLFNLIAILHQQVYDVNAIKVKNVTNGSVGRPVTFLVETAQAGPGNL